MIKKLSIALVAILTLGSCAREFNKVYRTTDTDFKYEYAKECYVQGKYSNAVTLLQDLVTIQKGTDTDRGCHRCLPKLSRSLPQRKVEIDGRATDV